jgi:hypothetical protein
VVRLHLHATGRAALDVLLRILSLAHTALKAALGRLRNVTLRDVWASAVAVLRALFVALPEAVAAGVLRLVDVLHAALKKTFGALGSVVFWAAVGAWWVVAYVPGKLWKAARAVGSSVASAGREVRAWIDPKA